MPAEVHHPDSVAEFGLGHTSTSPGRRVGQDSFTGPTLILGNAPGLTTPPALGPQNAPVRGVFEYTTTSSAKADADFEAIIPNAWTQGYAIGSKRKNKARDLKDLPMRKYDAEAVGNLKPVRIEQSGHPAPKCASRLEQFRMGEAAVHEDPHFMLRSSRPAVQMMEEKSRSSSPNGSVTKLAGVRHRYQMTVGHPRSLSGAKLVNGRQGSSCPGKFERNPERFLERSNTSEDE
ncbi:hypothetical protein OE88DRAFT_1640724 [Heliocybe sulcata]|uniref:Uncharacterized protein n=1 Tax=Heliocybe sulcata TaxID=5364 RepID=A0A5C3NGN9_9AGAM|nr:hypothetical protein OE88DRAFT_1640724 [Heliocybe sulcata]